MKLKTALVAAAMLMTPLQLASAEYAGYNYQEVPANSDVLLTVPFTEQAEGEFTVASVSGSTVNVNETLPDGAYEDAFYARLIDGAGEGLWSTITANGTGSMTLENADVAGFVSGGDTLRVYRHQTLASVFPSGMFGVSYVNQTQVYIFENDVPSPVINKSAAQVATYTTSGGGRWVGAGVNASTILKPETQFILRNTASEALRIITNGDAPDYSISTMVMAGGDVVIGTGYPLPVVLEEAGIEGNQRQVFFFDNTASGINKSATKVAAYTTSGGGRWVGSGVTGEEDLLPSQAFTLRLPSGDSGVKVTINKPY